MNGRKAFTLIELLVVIAIIAILMAILMPALKLARERVDSFPAQCVPATAQGKDDLHRMQIGCWGRLGY